jgi:2-polyprenyl-3-methyl-5-hydroxy-6-metoxy-1,4-benzoquinol methylase
MFNNLINRYDFLKIIDMVKEGKISLILGKVFRKSNQRVEASWEHKESPPINWWDIPQVHRRINKLISGSEKVDHYSYVKDNYFKGKKDMLALSLGCGSGVHEIQWAKTGLFKSINAYDLSQKRIEHAISVASAQKVDEIIHFSTDNVLEMELGENLYDFIILEGSLHHFSPLAKILERINKCLVPAGYVIVKDFVGPSRFQWKDRQLQVVNGLINLLPQEYKKKWKSQRFKTHVHRPSRLRMILTDPSEAVESEKILPLLESVFKEVEKREIGGTILQLLFHDIAFNFIPDDPKTKKLRQLCFDIEDILLNSKEISSDFIFGIYQKK